MKKWLTNIWVILGLMFVLYIGMKVAHIAKPSVDFQVYFLPNAHSWLNDGHTYEDIDKKEYQSNGDIIRHGYTPPGYTMLVAFCLWTKGGLELLYWINVFLLMGAVWMAWKMFKLITYNHFIIYTSLWLLMLSPVFLTIPKLYLSEGLFSFLTMLTLYLVVRAYKENSLLYFLLGIVALLASIETRTVNLLMLPFIIIPFALGKFEWKRKLIYIGVAVVSMIGILKITSDPHANSYLRRTISDGLKRFPNSEIAVRLRESARPHQDDWQKTFIDEHKALLKEQPFGLIKFYIMKSFRVWFGTDSGNNETMLLLVQGMHLLAFWVTLVLLLLRKIKNPFIMLFCGVVLYTNALTTVTLSICRYISPLAPIYMFMTVYLLYHLYRKFKPAKEHTVA